VADRAAHDRRLSARRQHARGDRGPAALKRALCACGAALALGAACGGGTAWDAEQWAATRPELSGRTIGPFGDVTPYALAGDDSLVFFVCHWSLDAPLRVSLPPDANSYERELLDKALRAWERVLPGLHFEVTEGSAPLRLRFRETGPENATTAADCEVMAPFNGGDQLDARLVSAQIDLRRDERDPWGKPIELAANQLLGSAAHELGHALGLQGHARSGKTVMVREALSVQKIGEKLNDEKKPKPLQEPAMQALYSLPSGTVIERRALAPGATKAIDAIATRARAQGATRATVRVGDHSAAVRWGSGSDLVYYLREPAKLLGHDLEFEDALVVR
jgi:Matrixin